MYNPFTAKIDIDDNDVLKELGNSLVTEKEPYNYYRINVKQEQVDNILNNQTLSFKQKKEILEKTKLLQLFSGEYIGADPRGAQHLMYDAKKVFEIKDISEYKEAMKKLNVALDIYQKAALNPYDNMKKRLEDRERFKGVMF